MREKRRVLALSEQEIERGEPLPKGRQRVGLVQFTDGVSEPISYEKARRIAATKGFVGYPAEKAMSVAERIRERKEGEEAGKEAESDPKEAGGGLYDPLSEGVLAAREVPEGYAERGDVPGYNGLRSELSGMGVDLGSFFEARPDKEALLKLYCAKTEGLSSLSESD